MRRATGRASLCSTTPPNPSSTLTHIAMNTPSSSATVNPLPAARHARHAHHAYAPLSPTLGDGQIHTFDTRMQRTTQVFQVW